MKQILISLILVSVLITNSFSQDKYFTRTGHAYFLSTTDIIDIYGNNHQVGSIINIKTGEMVFTVLIKSFSFTLATAEEHFNETYMESDKFPKATFKGKIQDIENINLSIEGKHNINVSGDLTIHGETKTVNIPATIEMKEGKLIGISEFTVNIDDYNITVPKIVEKRVAKIIKIKINMEYELYNK